MRYDAYEQKVTRAADIIRSVLRHSTKIIIGLAALTVLALALLATKGIVISASCPDEVVYGDKIECKATAFLASAEFEFSADGAEWTTDAPVMPGQYKARAVSKGTFGDLRYSGEMSFTIQKKSISLQLAEDKITYGRTPTLAADLVEGDELEHGEITLGEYVWDEEDDVVSTSVTLSKDSLKITNGDGRDVTEAYDITVPDLTVRVRPRALEVTVSDKSAVYNGVEFSYDGYEISDETPLINEDMLVAAFNVTITDVGSVPNTPELTVVDSKGKDISFCYDINTTVGQLTVEPRPLYVTSEGGEFVYDAQIHSAGGYTVAEDTPLVEGHYIDNLRSTEVLDAGSYLNLIYFTVRDSLGEEKKYNYSVFVETGTLVVKPRPIKVTALSDEFTYDGELHFYGAEHIESVEGLLDVHSLEVLGMAIDSAGTYELDMKIQIYDPAHNKYVTANYDVQYTTGTVVVHKRPITIIPDSQTWVYDGNSHVCRNFTIAGDGSDLIPTHYIWVESAVGIVDVGEKPNEFLNVRILANYIYDEMLPDIEVDDVYTDGVYTEGYDDPDIVTNEVYTDIEYWDDIFVTTEYEGVLIEPEPAEIDVTDNYEITVADGGVLKITPRPITVAPEYCEVIYDGKTHAAVTNLCIIDGTLAKGHELKGTCSGAGTIPGYYTITAKFVDIGTYYVYDVDDNSGTAIGFRSVKQNYDITVLDGQMQILPRPITVTPMDTSKIYDGTPLCATDAFVEEEPYALVEGHRLHSLYFIGEQTDAGEGSSSAYGAVILDAEDQNVSTYYDISYGFGNLAVEPRPITLRPNYANKIYDGTPLTSTSYTVVGTYGLVLGHEINQIEYIGSITDVGEASSAVDVDSVFIVGEGREVTKNYRISTEKSELTVTKRYVTVTFLGGVKVYDGLDTFEGEAIATTFSLANGHIATVTVTTPSADVGIYTPKLVDDSARIFDKEGNDVTDNYGVTVKMDPSATVEIIRRDIVLRPVNRDKVYDGTPLYPWGITVSPTSPNTLVGGHITHGELLGEQTEIGVSQSEIDADSFVIYIVDGDTLVPVTSNYNVLLLPGTLEVTDKNSGGGSGQLDTSGKIQGGEMAPVGEEVVCYLVKSEVDGRIYLKIKSFGSYGGTYWDEATSYPMISYGLYGADYLTGMGLDSAYRIDIESLTGQYALPYYLMTEADKMFDYTVQKSDVWYSGDASGVYSAYYSTADWLTAQKKTTAYEKAYRAFVYSQYLDIDTETLEYMNMLLDTEDLRKKDRIETILAIAKYISHAAKYDLEYDRALDNESNIAIAFLEKYKEGICQHYATAATLMYRAAGIPARYTIGFTGETVAGDWAAITSSSAHAWVEIYIDGVGWVQMEVTGSASGTPGGGGNDGAKAIVEIFPAYNYKTYDGEWLYPPRRLEGNAYFYELMEQGYYFKFSTAGQQLEVGISASKISAYTLYDPQGNDVTDQFDIVCLDGVLEVIDPEIITIEVQLYELQQYYNGKPLYYMEGDYRVLTDLGGARLDLTLNISLTDVGKLSFSVLNQNADQYADFTVMYNGEDITKRYRIEFVPLDDCEYPIIVDRRVIEITTASEEKTYDGKPLSSDGFYITKGNLASGDTIEVVTMGEIVNVGYAPNAVESIIIKDARGNDVTLNYDIAVIEGVLTVLPED